MNLCILILTLWVSVSWSQALPMTNDQELVGEHHLAPGQEQERGQGAVPAQSTSEFVLRITPKNDVGEERPPEQFETFVEELQGAGVRTADRRDLRTLSYTELARLLALWHLSLGRNFYESAVGYGQPDQPVAQ